MNGRVDLQVLLTEDNLAAALAVKAALVRLGCVVDHAKTGEEAIQLIGEKSYDIVFMDVGLPDMNGFEVSQVIRQRGIETPIIALTGHADKYSLCIDAGMQDTLLKPAQSEELQAMLQQYAKPSMA